MPQPRYFLDTLGKAPNFSEMLTAKRLPAAEGLAQARWTKSLDEARSPANYRRLAPAGN